jgi:hypothetical protein
VLVIAQVDASEIPFLLSFTMSASIDIQPLPEVLIEISKNMYMIEFGIVSLLRKTGYFLGDKLLWFCLIPIG